MRRALFAVTIVAACGGAPASPPRAPMGAMSHSATTFDDDVAFLRAHGPIEVLEHASGARVAVSARYQGRVMTSAVEASAPSLGWIHRKFIGEGKTGTAFDNYGGEDRFWLGPEGGQFGLYFPPGAPFAFDQWQTPHALQEGEWQLTARTATSLTFVRPMHVTNRAGATFDLVVMRTVSLLGDADVTKHLGASVPSGVRLVAFETTNRVTNTGASAWSKATGLLSVWILAMYNPSPDAHVFVPFDDAPGPLVNDAYFGKVPAERLVTDANGRYLVFTCDGQRRSKIGLGPLRARSVLGSYSESAGLLTVVHFDKPRDARDYVNSMWEEQREPYGGDVVNSYNDGPTEPGKPSLGGFYEIETSSPALALAPGASAEHTHRTFHFAGPRAALEPLAAQALGAPALHFP